MKHIIQTLAFVFLVLFSTKVFSQVSFAPENVYTTSGSPGATAIGDFNNDGLNDVAVGMSGSGDSLFVYLQNSSGGLNTTIRYYCPGFRSMDVGDVNNDGLTDVVIGYGDSVGIFYQQPNGTLGSFTSFYSGNTVDAIKIGDVNNDGLKDIVASNWNSPYISVYYQIASGGYTYTTYPSLQTGYDQLAIGDVNGDCLNDVILMSGETWGGFHVYTQAVNGTLNPYVTYGLGPGTNFSGVAIGDLNNDGLMDVVTSIDGNTPNAKICLWFQDPATHLLNTTPTIIQTLDGASLLEVAKLDTSGKNQIILLNGGWNYVTVFSQNGVGQYTTAYQQFATSGADWPSMAIGDINNDGKIDIAVGSSWGGSPLNGLLTFINTASGIPPGGSGSGSGGAASVNISTPVTSICTGTSVNFTATATNGGTSPTYQWEINNSSAGTNNAVFNTSSLTNGDTIKCIMTSNATCVSGLPATSNPIVVTVGNKGVAGTITVSRDTICTGLSVALSDQSASGTPIQWQSSNTPNNFSNISGADSSSYQTLPLSNTTYYRLVVGSGKCADTSAVQSLLVVPSPITSFNNSINGLQVTFSLLDTSGDITGYSWNFGDGTTSNQANPAHTFNADNTYHICLTVYNGSNCSYTYCADVTLKANGIANISGADNYFIYPNPFNDLVYINQQQHGKEIKSVELFDLTGRMIFSHMLGKEVNNTLKIDLPGLAQGVYYLKIQTEEANYIQPLVKQ